MNSRRLKNAIRNTFTGLLLKTIQTVIPFALRSVMIFEMGMTYAGLDSLFISILHVLNLAELGVGSAMLYSMYRPIAEANICQVKALLNLYKKYYRYIGLLILTIGILMIWLIPRIITGDVPEDINIITLYLINLSTVVISYWMFSYKASVILASQRSDVTNKVQLFISIVRYGMQFVSIYIYRNLYMFFTVAFLAQLLSNVIVYFVSNKMFPDYIPEGIVNPEARKHINRRIRDLFTAKLGGTITNSADSVVISSVLGLTVLAQYNNYYYILSALFGFMTIIFQSSLAGIGNSLVLDSREKNYKDFEVFSFLLSWIIGFFTVCLYCLLQPFMEIWVHAQNMFSDSYVILFCIYFYVYELALVWATYKDAGGIWHGDRYRPLCVTIVNLGLNLLTVRRLGLIGVIGSTVVSYVVVGMPWMLHNIFTMLFQKKMRHYVAKCLYGILITLIGCLASSFVCQNVQINGLLGLIFKIVIVAIIANVVFIIAYYKTVEFGKAKNLLTRLLMSYRMGR